MKKLIALSLVLLLLLAGCGGGKPSAPEVTPTPEPTAAPKPLPTPAPTPEPTPEPTEQPMISASSAVVKTSKTVQTAEPEITVQGAEQIYARCMPAVFDIEVYDVDGWDLGGGSGFFIDENGTGVTNFHVIYGAATAEVRLYGADPDAPPLEVLGVYAWSEEEDWAVIQVDTAPEAWLKIGDPVTAVGGATVYALGSPLGLSGTISNGIISNPALDIDGQTYIQTNAAISPGSSGGALVNKYGEVIGITAGGFTYGDSLNYAVPMSKLADVSPDTLYPINETYTLPSGLIFPDQDYVELSPGESFESVITALKYDTDEELSIEYEIDDPELLSCAWTPFGPEDTEVTLTITAGDTCGNTTIWLYLYTADSEELLDYDSINVRVAGGYVTPEYSYIDVGVCQTDSMPVTAATFDGTGCKLRFEIDEGGEDYLSCHWGDWDGDRIPLFIEGLALGDTAITVYLLDAETEEILATGEFYVYVVAAGIDVGEDMLFLPPGGSETVRVAVVNYTPDLEMRILVDESPSDVFSLSWEAVSDSEVLVTVTAEQEGYDWVYLSVVDENGEEVNYGWIDVYCSMDGPGPDGA